MRVNPFYFFLSWRQSPRGRRAEASLGQQGQREKRTDPFAALA
jgi:hypothetical protein